ncbi:hypothetical protein MNBD_GAMMA09-146, partial [hydrothermal vent metagenome]
DDEISKRTTRPKGIRFGVTAFNELEKAGDITRGDGGPAGLVEWASNIPWYSSDIYAWCDPSFDEEFELPPD